jgi:hypothetical protein
MLVRQDTRPLTTMVRGAGVALALLVGACGLHRTHGHPHDGDDDDDVDASTTQVDGGVADSAHPPDASSCDCTLLPATYNELTDVNRWETFDSTTVDPAARGFTGTAYDGHYVYFVPYDTTTRSSVVARYNPAAPFTSTSAWSSFDLSTVDAAAKGYVGSTFDGRYIYFAQFNDGTDYGGRIARFDTKATFDSADAWTIFDASSVNAASKGFAGTVFDGRYVYFVPYFNTGYDGVVTRYDTQAAFSSPDAWTTFDVGAMNGKARGFVSGTFDGRYVYLTPFANESEYSSTFVRYDTHAAFGDQAAWSTFDTTTVDPKARGYNGAVFDGHYVYFLPAYNWIAGSHGDVVRFDASAAHFTDQAAWTTFDITTVNPAARGYIGGVFDGRYLTLVPRGKGNGVVARYDTTAGFASAPSWSTFDLTALSPKATSFYSGGFDGRYIYMAEYWDGTEPNGLVVRFDAKSPPCIPASYRPRLQAGVASFF